MSILVAMCLFSLSMSISPGPVNIITFTTGMNHGVKKALPFVSGATIGFSLLLLLLGLGIGSIFSQHSVFLTFLAYTGTGYIVYLGYKIAVSKSEIELEKSRLPKFINGFLLQWLNPKAWTACLAGVSAFKLADSPTMLILFVTLYFVICYLSIASWALLGGFIQSTLKVGHHLRWINRFMGSGLILVALYLFYIQLTF